jgi:hypothetical protein
MIAHGRGRREVPLSRTSPGVTVQPMSRDPLDDLPPDSRREVVAAVRSVLGVDPSSAEDLVRSAEPLWGAMERTGGLVDSWGGGEFCQLFPRVLSYIRSGTTG